MSGRAPAVLASLLLGTLAIGCSGAGTGDLVVSGHSSVALRGGMFTTVRGWKKGDAGKRDLFHVIVVYPKEVGISGFGLKIESKGAHSVLTYNLDVNAPADGRKSYSHKLALKVDGEAKEVSVEGGTYQIRNKRVLILRPDKAWKTNVQEVAVKPGKAFTNQELLELVKESFPSDRELQDLQFLD